MSKSPVSKSPANTSSGKLLVLGGTSDAQSFCRGLQEAKIQFVVSVATEAGRQLAEAAGFSVLCGRLNLVDFQHLLLENAFEGVVDLTHPHAVEVTKTARVACNATGVAFWRYERPDEATRVAKIQASDLHCHFVNTEVEAAMLAAELGERILVTGSKACALYEQVLTQQLGKTVVYRVLPQSKVLAQLEAEGVSLGRIIAMLGPISTEMNIATLGHYGIEVLIAKTAGDASGTHQRREAAKALGIHLVEINRPEPLEEAIQSLEQLLETVRSRIHANV